MSPHHSLTQQFTRVRCCQIDTDFVIEAVSHVVCSRRTCICRSSERHREVQAIWKSQIDIIVSNNWNPKCTQFWSPKLLLRAHSMESHCIMQVDYLVVYVTQRTRRRSVSPEHWALVEHWHWRLLLKGWQTHTRVHFNLLPQIKLQQGCVEN